MQKLNDLLNISYGKVPGCWKFLFLRNNLQFRLASVWLHSLATPPLPVRLPSCLFDESARWSKLPKPFVTSFHTLFILLKKRHGKQNSLPEEESQGSQSRLFSMTFCIGFTQYTGWTRKHYPSLSLKIVTGR